MGTKPFDAVWYYYDHDSCRTEPHETYCFFLVADGKIIDECVRLSDWSGNGFDPSMLIAGDESDSIWFAEPDWSAAHDKFWYRKFYTETRTGQLMVLRPDEPELYYYPEGRLKADSGSLIILRLLSSIRIAIWILVGLLAVDLYWRWK